MAYTGKTNIERIYNVRDFGAIGDGTTDDTAALQAALAACQSAAPKAVFFSPPGYTYLISTALTTISQNIIIDFSGSTIKKAASFPSAAHAIVTTALNLFISNLVIDGNRGADDVQTLSITGGTPTSGTITMTFGGGTTGTVPFNATAQQVQSVLVALAATSTPNLTLDNIQVTGGPWPATAMVVKFIGNQASTSQSLIALGTNTLNNAATLTVTHTTTGASNNQPNNSYCIRFAGAATSRVIVRNTECNNNRGVGFYVNGGNIELHHCRADNNNAAGAGNGAGNTNGMGVLVDNNAIVRLYDFTASNNDFSGIRIASGSAEGQLISGTRTFRNGFGFSIAGGLGEVIDYFDSDSRNFGLVVNNVTGWQFGNIMVERAGFTSTNPSASAVDIAGVNHCRFSSITSRGSNGYGLAIHSSPNFTTNASSFNIFGHVLVDGDGHSNTTDPAVHISSGSQYNIIDVLEVTGLASPALSLGETFFPYNTSNNIINTIIASRLSWNVVYVAGAFDNQIGRVILRDVGNTGSLSAGGTGTPNAGGGAIAQVPGLFGFFSMATTGNASGSSVTNLGNWTGFAQGMSIKITGAGVAGADLYTTISALATTSSFTISPAASTVVTGAAIQGNAMTANTTSGSNSVASVSNTAFLWIGMPVRIVGAGVGGSELLSTITNIVGSTVNLADNASATLTLTLFTGIISANNTIGSVDHVASGTTTFTITQQGTPATITVLKPQNLMYNDAASCGNQIQDVIRGSYLTNPSLDGASVASNNRILFRKQGYRLVTAAYTVIPTDNVISADATGAAFTVTLPTAVGLAGNQFTIKRINTGSNNVTIATTSSQTIDGVTSFVLSAPYQSVTVMSTGSNWIVS